MRSWVGLEVRLLQLLAGEVGVELGRRQIGVAEHLLHRAQVAAAGEQVRREGVAQGVRAHPVAEPGGLGVAQDDLVEALPRQRPAAEVDEQLALVVGSDHLRSARAQIHPDRGDGLAADRYQPLLGALAPRADDAVLEVDVGDLERDRLRRPQPRRVHQLEQRPVPQGGGFVAAWLRQQPLHLGVAQDLRKLLAPPRRLEPRRRVVLDLFLPAQVPVEGAQAGGLAIDRRGRAGSAAVAVPLGHVGQEVGEIARLGRGRIAIALGEETAELEQVGAVRSERVARQPALELEVGEEVENEALVALAWLRLGGAFRRDCGHTEYFPGGQPVPA